MGAEWVADVSIALWVGIEKEWAFARLGDEANFYGIELATPDGKFLAPFLGRRHHFVEIRDRAVVQVRSGGPDAIERGRLVLQLRFVFGLIHIRTLIGNATRRLVMRVRCKFTEQKMDDCVCGNVIRGVGAADSAAKITYCRVPSRNPVLPRAFMRFSAASGSVRTLEIGTLVVTMR